MEKRDGNSAPTGWLNAAACRDSDPEAFFPTAKIGSAPYAMDLNLVRRICAYCPVLDECDAAAVGEHDGVWAGVDRAAPAALRNVQRATLARMGVWAA